MHGVQPRLTQVVVSQVELFVYFGMMISSEPGLNWVAHLTHGLEYSAWVRIESEAAKMNAAHSDLISCFMVRVG
jgi:hypothetical protein